MPALPSGPASLPAAPPDHPAPPRPVAAVASAARTPKPSPNGAFVFARPVLSIRPWADPVLDRFGHDPRSGYVERYWLPILGPSSTLLMRHFARRFDDEPDGYPLSLKETSHSIGVGAKQGPGAPFFRTLERVISFGFAQLVDDSTIMVHARMPGLTRRQVQRLTPHLQAEHDAWIERHRDRSHADHLQRRARALALSLFELGEDYEAAERQLHRWRFHPALTHEAVRWAWAQHLTRHPPNEPRDGDAA